MWRTSVLVAWFLVAWLVTGCSVSTAGRAIPSTSVVTVASGPRTFDLTKVNPCAIIPATRRLEFGLNRPPQDNPPTDGQPYCSFASSTGPGAGVFFDLRKSAQDTVAQVQTYIRYTVLIEGFKVPFVARPGVSQCEGFVQTGPSQYMSVGMNGLGKVPELELCKRAEPLVKIAIDTLDKLQPS